MKLKKDNVCSCIANSTYLLNELILEITKGCFLECKHCSSHPAPLNEELSFSEFKETLQSAKILGCKTICLSGGEPLSADLLFPLIKEIKKLGFFVSIYSSGIIKKSDHLCSIQKAFAERLTTEKLDKIIFHIFAASQPLHDLITQTKGSFNLTINSIKTCIDAGLHVELHFVPMKPNWFEFHNIIDLASGLRIPKVSILRFVPQGRGEINRNELMMSPCQVRQLKEEVQKAKSILNGNLRLGAPFNCLFKKISAPCTAGINRLHIRSDGTVFPCEAFKHSLNGNGPGNIKDKSLIEIWHSSSIFQTLRSLEISQINGICQACPQRNKCKGGCPAQRMLAWGNIYNSPDPLCEQAYSSFYNNEMLNNG